jgi:hypothetical protein
MSTLAWIAIVVFLVIGIIATIGDGAHYRQIGEGGLTPEPPEPAGPPPGSPLDRRQRQEEIRQMLQARSERQVRKGGEPLDIEAEIALLEGAGGAGPGAGGGGGGEHDPQLVEEVRQLVTARNERRRRAGEAPLDVEAEVHRTLDELDP